MKPAAADGELRAVRIVLFGYVVDDDTAVGDVSSAVEGHVLFGNKENGVSPLDLARHSLGQAS